MFKTSRPFCSEFKLQLVAGYRETTNFNGYKLKLEL